MCLPAGCGRAGRRQTGQVPAPTSARPSEVSNSVPILLLPPSEGKASDADADRLGAAWDPSLGSFARLTDRRERVVEALAAAGGGDTRLLGVKGAHLDRAQLANRTLLGAPTLPAWRRYTGVVWDHLDPASLAAGDRRRILVVSGLTGVARGDDPLPDYRLKMGANLPPLGKLSTWWRPAVTDELARVARGRTARRPRVLVDLLPKEHRAAWSPADDTPVVTVEFVDRTGAPGGHFAKAAKGVLARRLLLDGWDAIEDWRDDRFDLRVTWPVSTG